MSYEVLEQKIKTLPPKYYDALEVYLNFLCSQAIEDENLQIENTLQVRALNAFESMRNTAEENGFMTDEEIAAEIYAAREMSK